MVIPQTPPQALGVGDLMARAETYLELVAVGAAQRERERDMPHALVSDLGQRRLGTFRVPAAFGGPGGSVADVIDFVVALAAADSNIAQALRPHFGAVESLVHDASERTQREWFPRVLAGELFGLAHGEIGAANGVIQTRITRDGDVFRLDGTKYYSTGCLYADWLRISAVDDDGDVVWAIIPSDREGVSLVDDWDGMGQRLTASGTTRLDDVVVSAEEIVEREPPAGSRGHVTTFQQLFLAAVEAGIARNALTDAVWFTQKRSRPIKHSSASRSIDDPYIQRTVGEIAARAYAAEATVRAAAATLDRALERDGDDGALTEAAVEVAQAQFMAAELALKSAELIFDVGGGSATAREHNFDRHWRNARTVANHNPRDYKASVVGDYRLSGTEPPTSGLF